MERAVYAPFNSTAPLRRTYRHLSKVPTVMSASCAVRAAHSKLDDAGELAAVGYSAKKRTLESRCLECVRNIGPSPGCALSFLAADVVGWRTRRRGVAHTCKSDWNSSRRLTRVNREKSTSSSYCQERPALSMRGQYVDRHRRLGPEA